MNLEEKYGRDFNLNRRSDYGLNQDDGRKLLRKLMLARIRENKSGLVVLRQTSNFISSKYGDGCAASNREGFDRCF